MRRYDILFGILLILSIIDFALAAPVLVQEKRQAYADVEQIPKDVRTVWRKRVGEDDLVKVAEDYLETGGKQTESSDTHASSSSALPVPDHDPTNTAEVPDTHASSSSAAPVPDHEPTDAVEVSAPNPSTEPPSSSPELPLSLDDFYDFIPPWPSSEDDSLGYSSDMGFHQLPKQTPNPNRGPDPTYAFTGPSLWRTGSVHVPVPMRGSTGAVEASSTANPDLVSSTESPSQSWVASTHPDHFVVPWSDDESLPSPWHSSDWSVTQNDVSLPPKYLAPSLKPPIAETNHGEAGPSNPGPSNPMQSTENPGPSNSIQSTENPGPSNSIQSTENPGPSNPILSIENPGPSDPVQSTENPGPSDPVQSTENPEPSNPVQSTENPGPSNPVQSTELDSGPNLMTAPELISKKKKGGCLNTLCSIM